MKHTLDELPLAGLEQVETAIEKPPYGLCEREEELQGSILWTCRRLWKLESLPSPAILKIGSTAAVAPAHFKNNMEALMGLERYLLTLNPQLSFQTKSIISTAG